jgi:outer membrane lipoprotein-sorting protein
MKKSLILFFLVLISVSTSLTSQTLDEILRRYYSANGQDSLLKISNMKITGRMIQGSMELPYYQIIARPSSSRLELTFQGLKMIVTFNGKEGWNVNPFAGSTTPQPFSDDEIKSTRYQSDIDGMLWKSGEKGYNLTYDGKDDMDGTECYILKIVTKEGDIFKYYIDSDSYIPLRIYSKIKIMGNQSESDQYLSNYMMVKGIPVPGKTESRSNGQVVSVNVIDSVEPDVKVVPELFEKPKKPN